VILTIALILSVVVGIALGLMGGGGSILTVPILVYLLHLPTKAAVATSLLVVGSTSVVALALHARAGNVQWRTGAIFAGFAVGGAYGGGRAAAFLPGAVILALFTVLMLVTGVAMLRGRHAAAKPQAARTMSVPAVAVQGLLVGAVTGLVGAGGGFLVVPALVLLGGLPMGQAVATSLLVIVLNSFAAFAGYAGHVQLDYVLAAQVTGAALLGTGVGVWLSGRVDGPRLRHGFAWFVLAMAAFMIHKQLADTLAESGLPRAGFAAALAGALALAAWLARSRAVTR
jgi:hypothetical protein